MALKEKLKKMRVSSGMTQEAVAERLGISAQTVSKWERGLLSPDISLLPRIAVMYGCSIDSLFEMDAVFGTEHKREFKTKLHALFEAHDYEGVYNALINEIRLTPDDYLSYVDIMLHVLRRKMFERERVDAMLSLAERVEKFCTDDDIRNEVYRIMLQICAQCEQPKLKSKAVYYYEKLPSLRHSREVYAKFTMDGEAYYLQMKKNIAYEIDLAECAVRQLIRPDMSTDEKLYYFKKAAALYEVMLDGKYGGFYDVPLLYDYSAVAELYAEMGDHDAAREYVERIFCALDRHICDATRRDISPLLHDTKLLGATPAERNCRLLLESMMRNDKLAPFRAEIRERLANYTAAFPNENI